MDTFAAKNEFLAYFAISNVSTVVKIIVSVLIIPLSLEVVKSSCIFFLKQLDGSIY